MSVDLVLPGPTSVTSSYIVSHHHTPACDMSVDHWHKWTLCGFELRGVSASGSTAPRRANVSELSQAQVDR
jgi:hypothetical protein